MFSNNKFRQIIKSLLSKPIAVATIKGINNISGWAKFYQSPYGIVVLTEINGLPHTKTNFFAMHIHENGDCQNNFANTGMHYNPNNLPHPQHSGDLPPLLSNNGYALSAVLTTRFNAREIIGKSIIIHNNPDDFNTQPAGNSGNKIACGVINKN